MPKSVFIDLTGQKFGRLIVISRACNRSHGRSAFNVFCDPALGGCGKSKEVLSQSLRIGVTNSCGCLIGDTQKSLKTGIYSTKAGESGLNMLYLNYKRGATNRKYSFELTKEEFSMLTKRNCVYCGMEPNSIMKQGIGSNVGVIKHSSYTYNGVDRIDNTKGYTLENSATCCKICNIAKANMSLIEWQEWCDRFVNFQNSKKMIV